MEEEVVLVSERDGYSNPSNFDGKITSCRYVCSKEGHWAADDKDHLTKKHRSKTRIGCKVRMDLILEHNELFDLILEHNHLLPPPPHTHKLPILYHLNAKFLNSKHLLMIHTLDPKLHMSWPGAELVDHLMLATLIEIIKIICQLRGKGS
jgi:hypothetical protein